MSKPKAHYSDGTPKSRSVKPGWCCEDHAAELAEKCARLERERDDLSRWKIATRKHLEHAEELRARCEALETALGELCGWMDSRVQGYPNSAADRSVQAARALLSPSEDKTDGDD